MKRIARLVGVVGLVCSLAMVMLGAAFQELIEPVLLPYYQSATCKVIGTTCADCQVGTGQNAGCTGTNFYCLVFKGDPNEDLGAICVRSGTSSDKCNFQEAEVDYGDCTTGNYWICPGGCVPQGTVCDYSTCSNCAGFPAGSGWFTHWGYCVQ